MADKPLLEIIDLVINYETDDGVVKALNGVNIHIGVGETLGLVGESWDQNSDTSYTFHIRRGVKFHDGSEVKAEDVKFSLDRAINSAAVSYIVDFIDKVDVVDDYTVNVELKAPYAPALRNLSVPFAAIVPKAVVEADEEAFKLHPIGTGPYKFVEWKQGDSVTLERFDDYYAGPAETQKLVMKVIPEASQRTIALETGEVDLAYDFRAGIAQGCLRSGVQIRHMDNSYISNVEFIRFAQETGDKLGIKYQDAVRRGGSTNAGKISLTGKAVPVLVLGIPSRYVHSHYNFCAEEDVDATVRMAVEVIRGLDEERIARILRKDVI